MSFHHDLVLVIGRCTFRVLVIGRCTFRGIHNDLLLWTHIGSPFMTDRF